MHRSARHYHALAGRQFNRAALQINEQHTIQHEEELVIVVVLMPVVFALNDAGADNRFIHLAQCLIEPPVIRGRRNVVQIDNFQRAMQDVETSFVGISGGGLSESAVA